MSKYNKFCIDCGQRLKRWNAKRCRKCNGKIQSETQKGENNPFWKDGVIKKGNHCIDCGKKIKLYAKRCKKCFSKGELHYNWKGGKPKCIDCGKELMGNHNKRCKKCYVKTLKGKGNPNWMEGISKLPYPFEFNKELKEQIRKRDDYRCQLCGMTEEEHIIVYSEVLNVHHIDYDKQNLALENLITLCRGCNLRVNFNRKHWEEYFKSSVKALPKIE